MASFDQEKYFITNIIDPTIRVVTLSDIHGDIQALIIALRDCAKVIQKKNTILFDPNVYDQDMEAELLKDLNLPNDYIEDLNYEWIGTNTHVVICGDFIDPVRTKNCKKNNGDECSWYPQIELKIFMFINAINRQINGQGGKIIKLLGNHEFANIIDANNLLNYINLKDNNNNYYRGINRMQIFNVGNPGFQMLFEGGCGILVKINNIIFVHGALIKQPYSYYDDINQYINNPINQSSFNQYINNPINQSSFKQEEWKKKFADINYNENLSPLWNRDLGKSENMSERIKNESNTDFCNNLKKLFEEFCGDRTVITEDPNNLKLVVGHCIQSDLSIFRSDLNFEKGNTYGTRDITKSDSVTDVYNGEIYTGKSDFTDKSKIFGITMECGNNENNHNKIYRVDIGSSRGYDYFTNTVDNKIYPYFLVHDGKEWNIINNPQQENRFLYSKTPQVLIFNPDNTIDIVKSKIKNTRIHLPRPVYEYSVKKYQSLNINDPDNPNYQKKYLKYKNKYLQLKNKYI
jgi:hypothetical protein